MGKKVKVVLNYPKLNHTGWPKTQEYQNNLKAGITSIS